MGAEGCAVGLGAVGLGAGLGADGFAVRLGAGLGAERSRLEGINTRFIGIKKKTLLI